MKRYDCAFPLLFLCGFFLTLATGLPILPIAIIWQALFGSFPEVISWSAVTGIASGIIFWDNFFWWIALFTISGGVLYLIRIKFLRIITIQMLIVLAVATVTAWYGIGINKPAANQLLKDQRSLYEKEVTSVNPLSDKDQRSMFLILPDKTTFWPITLLSIVYLIILFPSYAFFYAHAFYKEKCLYQ